MASTEPALVREYVSCWLANLAGDVAFTASAFADMNREGFDLADVTSALENSSTGTVTKENPHDVFFSMVGTTCDDEIVRVTISLELNVRGLCVHQVERL